MVATAFRWGSSAWMNDRHPGERIATIRAARGLSQTDLARIVGVTGAYISQLESGAKDGGWRTLQRVADALGVGFGDLFAVAPTPCLEPALFLCRGPSGLEVSGMSKLEGAKRALMAVGAGDWAGGPIGPRDRFIVDLSADPSPGTLVVAQRIGATHANLFRYEQHGDLVLLRPVDDHGDTVVLDRKRWVIAGVVAKWEKIFAVV